MQNFNRETIPTLVSVVTNVDPQRKNSPAVRNLKRAGVVLGIAAISVGAAVAIRPVMQKLSDTFDK